jgi:predicted DNA-binding transcriptional regulator YafY
VLREAIASRRKVRTVYEDAAGRGTERVVWPLGLWFWAARWTVGAWCELRGDFRNFPPDRVADAETLDAPFELDEAHDLDAFHTAMVAQGMPD